MEEGMILFYPKEDCQLFKYKLLPTGALISRSGALIKLQSCHHPNVNTGVDGFLVVIPTPPVFNFCPSVLEYQFHGNRAGIRLLWGLPKAVHIRIRAIARTSPVLLSESIRW
jgi:hypothetical protein